MAYRWGAPAGGSQGWGGPGGGGSAQAPVGLPYTFSTATSASGISNGQVRINNVNPGSATTMWIAQTDDSTQDRGTVLNTLSAGGLVYINTAGEDGVVGVFRVTAMVDSGTYYTLTVDRFSGALPNDGAEVRVTIAPVEVTGVKKAAFRLSQAGTSAPTIAETYYNSLGETPTFAYSSAGAYFVTWPVSGVCNPGRTVRLNGHIKGGSVAQGWFASSCGDTLFQYDDGTPTDELSDGIMYVEILS